MTTESMPGEPKTLLDADVLMLTALVSGLGHYVDVRLDDDGRIICKVLKNEVPAEEAVFFVQAELGRFEQVLNSALDENSAEPILQRMLRVFEFSPDYPKADQIGVQLRRGDVNGLRPFNLEELELAKEQLVHVREMTLTTAHQNREFVRFARERIAQYIDGIRKNYT